MLTLDVGFAMEDHIKQHPPQAPLFIQAGKLSAYLLLQKQVSATTTLKRNGTSLRCTENYADTIDDISIPDKKNIKHTNYRIFTIHVIYLFLFSPTIQVCFEWVLLFLPMSIIKNKWTPWLRLYSYLEIRY